MNETSELQLTSTPKANQSITRSSSFNRTLFNQSNDNSFSNLGTSPKSLTSTSFEKELSATNMENTMEMSSVSDKVIVDSMPVERFVELHITEHIQCNICLGVPLSPVMIRCGHFHCKKCLNKWLDTADTCTAC